MFPSVRMRCVILSLFMVVSAGCVATALVVPVLAFRQGTASVTTSGREDVSLYAYVLRDDGGEVCVYENEELILHTGVATASLPQTDRTLLSSGIPVESPQELAGLLEDLTS